MLPQITFTLPLFCIFQHKCHDTAHNNVEHKSVLKQKNLMLLNKFYKTKNKKINLFQLLENPY